MKLHRKELTQVEMMIFYWPFQEATRLYLALWGFDPNRSVTVHEGNRTGQYFVEQSIDEGIRGNRADVLILDEEV